MTLKTAEKPEVLRPQVSSAPATTEEQVKYPGQTETEWSALRPPRELRDKIQFTGSEVFLPIQAAAAGWDFDGTIADTERLHKITFKTAVEEICGHTFSEKEWSDFKPAFGLTEAESCKTIAKILLDKHFKEHQAEAPWTQGRFERLSGIIDNLADSEVSVDSVAERLARLVQKQRTNVFLHFEKLAELSSSPDPAQGVWIRSLGVDANSLPAVSTTQHRELLGLSVAELPLSAQDLQIRHAQLSQVQVPLMPCVWEKIEELKAASFLQGVCTSSARSFVEPLLRKFGFELGKGGHFQEMVTQDDMAPGSCKPEPNPWWKLCEKLNEGSRRNPQFDAGQMVCFENSASGAVSALLAGMPVYCCARNVPAFIGKAAGKLDVSTVNELAAAQKKAAANHEQWTAELKQRLEQKWMHGTEPEKTNDQRRLERWKDKISDALHFVLSFGQVCLPRIDPPTPAVD